MKKLSGYLYNVTRKMGKAASTVNTIETIASGDPKKIAKRLVRYNVNKSGHKATNSVLTKLLKKL